MPLSRFTDRLPRRLLIGAPLLLLLLVPGAASAAGSRPDQINDPATSVALGASGSAQPDLYQSFTPSQRQLGAVEVRLLANNLPDPNAGWFVASPMHIRDGSPSGAVVGESFGLLAGIQYGQFLAHYGFSPALTLKPGHTYVIDLFFPSGNFFYWAASYGDPYPAGQGYGQMQDLIPGLDFNFKTFTQSSMTTP
jgi:hypothetical protein